MAEQIIIKLFQEYSNQWITWTNEFSKTDFFQHFGLIIVALVAGAPAWCPCPNEFVTTPLFALGVNPIYIVLAVGIGGFIGDILLYYFGYHLLRKLTRGKSDRLLDIEHWIHRWGRLIYVASPLLIIGIGDIIMIVSGHQGVKLSRIAPFLFAGEILRGMIGIGITIGIIQIPQWLNFW